MAATEALRSGDNTLSLNEHAAQLRTQAQQLLDNAGESRRSFRFQTIVPLIQSIIELYDKALNQPTPAELKAVMHSIQQTTNDIKKDTTTIRRTTEAVNMADPRPQRSTQQSPMT